MVLLSQSWYIGFKLHCNYLLQHSPQLIIHSQSAVETLFSKLKPVVSTACKKRLGSETFGLSVIDRYMFFFVLPVFTEEWTKQSVRLVTHCRLNQVCVTYKGSVSTSQRTLNTVTGKGSVIILRLTFWYHLVHELCPLLYVKCNKKNSCIVICNNRQWTPRKSGIPLSESYTIVLQHQDEPSIYSLFRPYFLPEDGDGSYHSSPHTQFWVTSVTIFNTRWWTKSINQTCLG